VGARRVCEVLVYNIEILNNNTKSVCKKFADTVNEVHVVTGACAEDKSSQICASRGSDDQVVVYAEGVM